jgi:iron complex outermembrane receptor protein
MNNHWDGNFIDARCVSTPRRKLSLSVSLMAGVAVAVLAAPAAYAAPADQQVEELVVTGTNIRGVAPVGQAITQLDRSVIETTAATTVQQLLSTAAPQLSNFGSAGVSGSGTTVGSFEPRIRGLGGISSASTLVLVDGHRIAPGGGGVVGDPNVVPSGAVERIEILADGASATYGSDAVAGVINVITRKNYNGYEVNGQYSFSDDWHGYTGNLVYGHSWDTGSVIATYGYTSNDNMPMSALARATGNQSNSGPGATGLGGTNFRNYQCSPATAVPAAGQPGAGLVFPYPYAAGTGLVNNTTLTGLCTSIGETDTMSQAEAHRIYLSLRQNLGDRVKLSASLQYSKSLQISRASRGGVNNVTVYGPGSTPPSGAGQINPFFQGPAGVNRETISFNFDEMFGPGRESRAVQENFLASAGVDVDLGHEWLLSLSAMAALPKNTTQNNGGVCTPCAIMGLNGTAVASGVATTNLIAGPLGTVITETRLPLTTANALDVWNTGAANRTSALVRQNLLDAQTFSYDQRPVSDFTIKFDGPLISVPAGKIRAAVGAEYYSAGLTEKDTSTSAVAGTSQVATFSSQNYKSRHTKSVFAQLNIPLIGGDMAVPFVQELTFDVSARYDHYNDLVGVNSTKNPRFGLSWVIGGGLQARASYGTSFTAPRHGQNQPQANTFSDFFGSGNGTITLPAGYPNMASIGCNPTQQCTLTAGGPIQGINIGRGGSVNLKPMTGRTWSFGADYRAPQGSFADGFRISVTNWGATYRDLITVVNSVSQAAVTPGLEFLLLLDPSPAVIAAYTNGLRQTSPLPASIRFIVDGSNQNLFHFRGKGVDIDTSYTFDTGLGAFSVGANVAYKYDWKKQTGRGDVLVVTNIANAANGVNPVKLTARGNIGWRNGPIRADFYVNHTGSFYYQDPSPIFLTYPCPKGANPPAGDLGCEKIASHTTFDVHLAYDFNGGGFFLDGLQIYGDVRNILDKGPPWTNGANGFETSVASSTRWADPRGRVISAGVRKRW